MKKTHKGFVWRLRFTIGGKDTYYRTFETKEDLKKSLKIWKHIMNASWCKVHRFPNI